MRNIKNHATILLCMSISFMENKTMELNLHIDKIVSVAIRGKKYPVAIAGTGIPCLSIGQGTLGQRTLSQRFKKMFKVYSTDLYFDARYGLKDFSILTMDQIIDDIAELAKELNLSKFVIFGFSAYGIVALEFAKKYPDLLAGIILSGTPPNSNPEVGALVDAYFEKHAEPERKKLYAERSLSVVQKDLDTLNSSQRFILWYVYQYGPRNFYIADFDCSAVYDDIYKDKSLDYLFSTILPATDVMKNLEQINCPVFLAAGMSDYNSYPFLWTKVKNLPKHMAISFFEKSGHWPHYEESALFDERIEVWVKENFLK